MNSFGLGLVLNFTDNATTGMSRASNMFREMSTVADSMSSSTSNALAVMGQAGYGMVLVGDKLLGAGQTILGVINSLANNVIKTGSEFESFRITLTSLYGDAEKAEEQLNNLMDFSAKSPFEIADVKDMLVLLQSTGVDAFGEIESSLTGVRQESLAWMGDLMAFKPDVPAQKWKLAFSNYIGSGESKSLRNVLDMGAIPEILGHEQGKTVEERMNDIVEIVSNKNLTHLMDNMFGTWSQVMSNVSDQVTKFYLAISDAGAFNVLKGTMTSLAGIISGLSEEEFTNITNSIAEALVMLFTPIANLAQGLVGIAKRFIALTSAHPVLAKIVIVVVALLGVTLLLSGALLKLTGFMLIFLASLKIIGGMSAITEILAVGFKFVLSSILPLIAIATVMYFAWKKNLFGIRDLITTTMKDVGTILRITFDALADNTISADLWQEASDLGILPFVESLLDAKYAFGLFVDGFEKGFASVFEYFNRFTTLAFSVFDSANKVGSAISKMVGKDTEDTWTTWGDTIGKIVANLIIFVAIFKAVSTVITIVKVIMSVFSFLGAIIGGVGALISGIVSVVVSGISIIGSIFSVLIPIITFIATLIGSAISIIVAFFATPIGLIVLIIAGIVALGAIIYKFRDQIASFFVSLWTNIVSGWNSFVAVIMQNPIVQFIVSWVSIVVSVFLALVDTVVSIIKSIINVLVSVITGVVQVIVAWFKVLVAIVKSVVDIIVASWRFSFEIVRLVFYSIMYVIKSIFDWIYDTIISPFVDKWVLRFQLISAFMQVVGEVFKIAWNDAVSFVSPLIEKLAQGFSKFGDNIKIVLGGIKDFFVSVFDSISEVAGKFFGWIADKLGWIVEVIGKIGGFVVKGINGASEWVAGAGDDMKAKVGLATGGYVKETGIAMLHPNEVVINSALTDNLRSFLNNDKKVVASSSGAEINREDNRTTNVSNNRIIANNPKSSSSVSNDNTIKFDAGSIVINVAKATQEEAEKFANKIIAMIIRKTQLKNMAIRA